MFTDLTARDLTELLRAIDERRDTAPLGAAQSLTRARSAVEVELGRRVAAINALADHYATPAFAVASA